MKRPLIDDHVTIRKKVYRYLRERILTAKIAPDERLVETKIAKEVGTSRTPIREALHNLEVEKLVKSIPRVGYVVEKMSLEDLEQICELREVIEGLAIRRAVERSHKKLLSDLTKNVTRQEQEISKGNYGSYVELDTQFHEIIGKLSGNERAFELIQTLRRHMLRYGLQIANFVETAMRSMGGHKVILDAVGKGDSDGAERAIREHIFTARKDISEYLFEEELKKRVN